MMPCLVVIAREPTEGQVKTRIAATLGDSAALALYRCALADTLALVATFAEVERAVSFTPATVDARRFFAVAEPGFVLIEQQGAGLGERLLNTFRALAQKNYSPVVLIGSDSPSLPHAYIQEAFTRLSDNAVDVVLGAAADGGYYLIGMREPHPILFERISWSTDRVAKETRDRAKEGGLEISELAEWYDLDCEKDLRVLERDAASTGDGRAPRTVAFIRLMGGAER